MIPRGHLLGHVGGLLPDHEQLMLFGPILVLLLIASIVVVTWLAKRGVLGDPERTVDIEVSLAAIASALSLGAAAIHIAVIGAHLEEGIEFGAFFLAVGWFQMLWPVAWLLRRSGTVATIGLFVNLAIPAVWLVSRTVGLPFGPAPWVPEPIGLTDAFATALELGIVGLLLPVALPDRADLPHRLVPIKDTAILAGFAVSTVALMTGYMLLLPAAAAG